MATANAFSDEFEIELLDYFFGLDAVTFGRGGIFLALCATDITDGLVASTMDELPTTSGYARQAIDFNAAAAGAISNITADTVFTASGGAWATVTAVAIMDLVTDNTGKILAYDNSITDATLADGDTLTFAVGAVTVSVN